MKAGSTAVALLVGFAAMAAAAVPRAGADLQPERATRQQAIAAADQDPKVREQRRRHPDLATTAALDEGKWEVGYFSEGEQLALVVVSRESGEVTESWTGYQVNWKMARGYPGAFGHKLNAPYVFLPLCAVFLLGLVDWRRLRRLANLDLLVLLGFGASHFFFNRAEIGLSVPLAYPVLLYLLGRCLWIGLRGRGEGLRPVWPVAWLLVAALFLMGFRVGLNVADSGAIDVGYAGVVGADRIAHGEPIYDNFPSDVSSGDTYGPVDYLAYLPFEAIWPWSGKWDDLPAAHGAAVLFDVATFLLLILLALRIRPGPAGQRLASTLAFGWAAFPYTAYVLESNSNDSLVAALLVAALLLAARPMARGAMLAAATWAKFAPAVLAPVYLAYRSSPASPDEGVRARKPRAQDTLVGRPALLFVLGFAVVTVLALTWPAIDPGLKTFYDRTLATQAGRESPFSIWGQAPSLEFLRIALLVLLGGLSLAFAFVPRRKSLVQLAALSAALLILLQLTLQHWFYLYVVWFYPLLLVALAALEPRRGPTGSGEERAPSPARTSQPAPAR
ncbi:MAG TPA: hypothetical protein VFS26_01295 [Solirubrobacterales bacterium]|nr:hypothetical protein [Solirubrobacterales bacterium]